MRRLSALILLATMVGAAQARMRVVEGEVRGAQRMG